MVLKPIHSDRLLEEFIQLTKIDSLSFMERDMADYIKRKMEELGITAYEDDAGSCCNGTAGNVYGYFYNDENCKQQEGPLLFSAHMDTVSPGIGKKAMVHEDGTITSDGTTILGADDLSALAIILEVIREIKEEGLAHRDIELLFPIAEEAYGVGSAAFDYSKLKAKEAYVLDVSGPVGTISMQEPTLISYEITVKGQAAHAGFEADKGVNAIAIAAEAITKIKQGQIDEETTFNIGLIKGGAATNIVPDLVVIKGEVRSIDHEKAVKLVEAAAHTFEETAHRYGGTVESKHTIHLIAYQLEEEDPLVKQYARVCEKLSIPVVYKRTFGGSDNNMFWRNGIRGVVIANGMNQIHTREEFTSVDELVRAAQTVKYLMTI